MARVIFVVGLPGAGKTTLLTRLQQEGYSIFDDYKAGAYKDSPAFHNSRHYARLLELLREQKPCVISDIDFCKKSSRTEAEAILKMDLPGVQIEWRYFAKDREACAANIRHRNREHLQRDLQKLSEYCSIYSIPSGVTVLPVVSAAKSADQAG
jgi:hypothetical protein